MQKLSRTLLHLLATGACQVQSEDAYYGHLVLRLMGCFVLMYTSRVVCQGQLTMEEIIFSLKHYWRFVDSEALELKALSQGVEEKSGPYGEAPRHEVMVVLDNFPEKCVSMGEHIPTATLVEHTLLTQGFMGTSTVSFPHHWRPQHHDSTWPNLVDTLK